MGKISSFFHGLDPDLFTVEGDGDFEDIGDTGSAEGGGILLVFDLFESRIQYIVH